MFDILLDSWYLSDQDSSRPFRLMDTPEIDLASELLFDPFEALFRFEIFARFVCIFIWCDWECRIYSFSFNVFAFADDWNILGLLVWSLFCFSLLRWLLVVIALGELFMLRSFLHWSLIDDKEAPHRFPPFDGVKLALWVAMYDFCSVLWSSLEFESFLEWLLLLLISAWRFVRRLLCEIACCRPLVNWGNITTNLELTSWNYYKSCGKFDWTLSQCENFL